MSPEESQTVLCIVSLVLTLIALAIGYVYGYADGKASKEFWTKKELEEKLNSN